MRSLLVFPCRRFGFHEESLSLAEKTRFASPQRRMAANRCMQLYRETPKILRKLNENDSKTN